jgi:phosphoribosyl-AMP cyclohydrolase
MVFDPATLTFDAQGLIPAIAQDADTGEVLMMAWMNKDAVTKTQELVDFRVDCDRDCLLMQVRQIGPACHTNRRSCFYTAVRDGVETELMAPETTG